MDDTSATSTPEPSQGGDQRNDQPRPRRRIIAISAGAALTLLASVLLAVRTVTPQAAIEIPATDWSERISACAPADTPIALAALNDTNVHACLVQVAHSAAELKQIVPLSKALRVEMDKDLRFYPACHDILHDAGAKSYRLYPDMAAMIDENRYDVCGYAFIHGGMDTLALDRPNIAEFQRIYDTCVEVTKDPGMERAEGLCTHSLGHVAWEAALSIEKAAEYCAIMPISELREICGNGVIMQMYQPVVGEPDFDIANADTELYDLCSTWPDPERTGYGCYAGAGYVYLSDAHNYILDNVYGNSQAFTAGSTGENTLSSEAEQTLRGIIVKAVKLCKKHTDPKGVSACLGSVAQEVPAEAFWSPRLISDVCPRMNEWEQRCSTPREFF